MKLSIVIKLFLLALVSISMSACSSSDEKEQILPHYYVVEASRGAVAENFAKDRVLYLNPVKITSQFREQDIVFKVGDSQYQSQYPHQFYTQPQDIFTDQLQRWLQQSGLFTKVITKNIDEADMVLDSAITALYGDNREKYPPAAVIEMQFFLTTEDQQGVRQALFQTGLQADVAIDKTTPENVVKGWKIGLGQLLETVEDDLSGFFDKRTP